MQETILEIQNRMAVYAKHARSNRDALEALEKLKALSVMVMQLEEELAVYRGEIAHG